MSNSHPCCAIVVSYNGMKWIEKCISSLRSSEVTLDIVVVDNGSDDGTIEWLDNEPDLKVFKNASNLGFGKANNIGLQYAYEKGYETFFLLNQDAWIKGNTLESLLTFSKREPQYGILSPVHYDGTGVKLDAGFSRYMRLRKSSNFFRDFKNSQLKTQVYEVSFVNAAAWLIRRECLEKTGLFHPLFKHYGEDDNYIQRVKWGGMKAGVLGGAKILHDRADRFKSRIDKKAKFRSMVLMAHLNPLRDRGKVLLWFISMGNLFSITSFWFFLSNLQFYRWGVSHYDGFVKEVAEFGSKDYNPLKGR